MGVSSVAMHTTLALALIVSYTVLTGMGLDANALLGILAGQAAGAGIQKVGR